MYIFMHFYSAPYKERLVLRYRQPLSLRSQDPTFSRATPVWHVTVHFYASSSRGARVWDINETQPVDEPQNLQRIPNIRTSNYSSHFPLRVKTLYDVIDPVRLVLGGLVLGLQYARLRLQSVRVSGVPWMVIWLQILIGDWARLWGVSDVLRRDIYMDVEMTCTCLSYVWSDSIVSLSYDTLRSDPCVTSNWNILIDMGCKHGARICIYKELRPPLIQSTSHYQPFTARRLSRSLWLWMWGVSGTIHPLLSYNDWIWCMTP